MGLDFLEFGKRPRKDITDIKPEFTVTKSKDLMVRSGDFYAVWVEDKGLWSTDEDDLIKLVDNELDIYAKKYRDTNDIPVNIMYMRKGSNKVIDEFHHNVQKQRRDNYRQLDAKIIFSNQETKKDDYATKKLPYPLDFGEPEAWNELVSVLYSPEEKRKLEWSIGCIVSGDSKKVQKFVVLYGDKGTGKSTVLHIIEKLFKGYYASFDAKTLGSTRTQFPLEAFKDNPLVAIQHDGDLSHIEDNTTLNSLVSHEKMLVNTKYGKMYEQKFNSFLYMGTNRPVKISDAKSGLLRRLIDISPTGETVDNDVYNELYNQIDFELGKIAQRCLNVYEEDKHYYDDYIPIRMMDATNDFYNFMIDRSIEFERANETTLKSAYADYKIYCNDANAIPFTQRIFKEELKNYFEEFRELDTLEDGKIIQNHYILFKKNIFKKKNKNKKIKKDWLELKEQPSLLDEVFKDCKAQYTTEDGKPKKSWDKVKTTLKDISTDKTHYVIPPDSTHIVVDFDKKDSKGEKSLKLDIKAARDFPPTYAEVSQSGQGLHLHYIYAGDPNKLSPVFAPGIEVKVYTDKTGPRRRVTFCNDIPIATISSGLPTKEKPKMVNKETIENERHLINKIQKALSKEVFPETHRNVEYIKYVLDIAYESGMSYNLTKDMRNAIYAFASSASNSSQDNIRMVRQMKFQSADQDEPIDDIPTSIASTKKKLGFLDIEVYPNLFIVCWKYDDGTTNVNAMINPSATDIEALLDILDYVGFNCINYDNPILYARMMGYDNEQCYKLSQAIISKKVKPWYESKNLSYMDIYETSSEKMSLKKFEVKYDFYHREWGHSWDEPVPEELWEEAVNYCKNDVLATELVYHKRKPDVEAKLILSDYAGMIPNTTINNLAAKIIFQGEKNPQEEFNYRFMGDTSKASLLTVPGMDCNWDYTLFDDKGRPIYPGYKHENGVSTYRGEEVGEGGYVYSEPGIYRNVALLDIASMHPSSIIAEELFGERYTRRFKELVDIRIAVKHKDFAKARKMLNGALNKYLEDESQAKDLAQALKIVINSVYGLTWTKYPNAFRDEHNIDNIVAKRGALFMINLKYEVQSRGYTVAHIKTDSIKIPNADKDIIDFVMAYGKLYGYNFEHEDTYEKMCLVNDAVYIAKYIEPHKDKNTGKDIWWTATGKQFAVPYVYKTLFSGEDIEYKDMCETISVTSALYLDMNELLPQDEHDYKFVGRVGNFTPTIHGGLLMRQSNTGYSYATGCKGYRWLESTDAKKLCDEQGADKVIDISFYKHLVDDAIAAIEKYGDFHEFAK